MSWKSIPQTWFSISLLHFYEQQNMIHHNRSSCRQVETLLQIVQGV